MVANELTTERMETRMREYFDACNSGDPEAIAAHFVDDAVHYFPPDMYDGPFEGARTIGEKWATAVEELGSVWTIDRMLTDPSRAEATMEWTHFKTFTGTVLRGDEWYKFDSESGLITEIRAYYAAPQDDELDRHELGGFDYEARGYSVSPPIERE